MTDKVIAIVGPTATGKTEISVKLAKKLGGEIISADSRLVYRDFNIGTAKPSAEEMQGIPHYMIDVEDPQNTYTAGRYKKEAGDKIKEILNKNRIPIVVGGTGFYIRALLEGLDIPDIDPDHEFRKKMQEIAETKGKEVLHSKLKVIDPVIAEKLHPNDTFRVIRALEIHQLTGEPVSDFQTFSRPEYDVLYIGLNARNRDFLYDRINKRVLQMIDKGLVEEVKMLIDKYGRTISVLKTLGYREICDYLNGLYSLEEAIEQIQKNTRNFAKRQLTWFRANQEINWFYIDENTPDEICEQVIKLKSNYKT